MENFTKKLAPYLSGCIFLAISSPIFANNAITAEEISAIKAILSDKKPVATTRKSPAPKPKKEKPVQPQATAEPAKYIPTEKLVQAIRMGDLKSVKRLIKQGADPTPGRGEPLTVAVRTRNLAVARELLKHRADPNQEGFAYENSGVLGTAVRQQNYEMVKLLLEYKANPNIGTEYLKMNTIPDTPLYIAVQQNDFTMVKLLIDFGARTDVPYPISMQAQVNDKRSVTTRTLLNHVNQKNNPQLYNFLLAQGARPIVH